MKVLWVGIGDLRKRAHGMPDLQSKIPQRVEHGLCGDLPCHRVAEGYQQDVEVAVRAQLLTAVAP
jgi:hypothetical protein